MSLTVQNLRAVGPGVEPASLLPGQICFNVTDKILFTGDGSDFKTSFDGTVIPGVPGAGWFSTPLDFSQFSTNFIVNPEVYGDIPTDGQVLTWDSSLGHTIWTNSGATGNTVYLTTNANVAAAPGATLTAKINTAIGVVSPDPNDWVVVTGLPGDVFQGLYFFDTSWIKASNFAFPDADQVPYSNTVSGLTANDVQEAIDELDTLTAAAQGTADAAFAAAGIAQDAADAAQADATQALADAAAAQSTADAALPRAGGTMTGTLNTLTVNTEQINVGSGYGITFAAGASGTIFGISGVVNSTSITTAASSAAVKTTYDLAAAALARSGGTMTGAIVFAAGQTFPISGIDIASGTQLGVVQVGNHLNITAGGVLSANVATTSAAGVVQVGNHLNVSGSGLLDVRDATTMQAGAVQLVDALNSSSDTQALTANQGRVLQGQINALTISGSTILAGSINASNGLIQTVTTQGAAAGFSVGNPLPAPAPDPSPPGNNNYYVIVTAPGTFTPPGGGGAITSENGDWVLSNGTIWQELEVGSRPSYASTVTPGIIQLATTANTIAGVDGLLGVTPLSLQGKLSDSVSTTCSLLIASSTAVKTAYDVGNAALPRAGGTMTGNITFQDAGEGIVFNGGSQVFAISDSTSTTSSTTAASSTALKAAYDIAAAAIPCAVVSGLGDIVASTATGVPTALPLGLDGQVLIVNTTCTTGLEWVSDTPGDVTSVTSSAPIQVDNTDPQNPIVSIDAASLVSCGAVQLSDSLNNSSDTIAATAGAVCTTYNLAELANTTANAAIPCASFLAKGNLLAATAAGAYSAITVGTNGQVLIADTACTAGLKWGDACYVPSGCYNAAGDIVVGTGVGTYVALPVGTDCQTLVVNSACTATGGVTWGVSLTGYTCSATPFNTALGAQAGDSITSGTNNTFIGFCAGTSITDNGNNTFVGSNAGRLQTSVNNTALGANALANSGANNNTGLGHNAGRCLTNGSSNTFVGAAAGDNATTADNAVAVGYNALGAVATANGTVAIGTNAGEALTSGANTTLVGFSAGDSITTGARNTIVGHTSGGALTTGTDNTIIGALAANLNTGTSSTIVGACAGAALTLGGANVFLGAGAGDLVTTGFNNTVIGDVGGSTTLTGNAILAAGTTVKFQANNSGAWSYNGTDFGTAGQFLASQGSAATPIWCTLSLACVPCAAYTAVGDILVGTGASTFTALPTGTNSQVLTVDTTCTATGGLKWSTPNTLCGYTNTTAPLNTALGFQAGDSVTTGTDNVSLGYNAGTAQVAGSQSVFIGSGAGQSTNAGGVTAIGFCAAQGNISAGCGTYIGFVAGRNATSVSNTYVGALTGCAASNTSACGTLLGFCAGSAITSGNGNTFLGHQTGRFVTTGCLNVAIGVATFQSATTGACNVAIGCGALGGNITGNGSTAIGTRALTNTTGTAVNTAVGSEAGAQTTGTGNSYFGVNAGCAVNTGTCNTLIGRNSGTAITTGSCNTIVGSFAGSTTLANNVVLADGAGTVRFQANATGAWAPSGTDFGTSGQVLKSAGTGAAPAWSSALYGAFSDSSIQTNDDLVNGNAVTLDTTASSNGFSIVSGSQITATTAGVYNIQISLQFEKTDAGTDAVEVWFKKNGTNIANSNTNIELSGNGAKQLFALNLVEPLTAGQYLEVWWYSADADVQLTAVAAGTRPAIPSAIVTIVPVGA